MNKKDSLGDRMKTYENASRNYLMRRTPVIIRLDGKAFHSFTKGFQKQFDMLLMRSMWETSQELCSKIQGCKIGYTQSDEISLLLTDYESIDTCAWFDNGIQKMVSVSASMATLAFNDAFANFVNEEYNNIIEAPISCDADIKEIDRLFDNYFNKINTALFDSRVFTLPKEEVCNYFIWRQQDATRNAIQMVGQSNFSHKQLNKKSCNDIQEMLFQEKGINFNDFPVYQKRGACIVKEKYTKGDAERTRWIVDKDIPIFTQDRDYIEKFV